MLNYMLVSTDFSKLDIIIIISGLHH